MFKSIALLRKKPGLTREALIDYYETRHAPLIHSLFDEILDYRRNYVDLAGAFIMDGAGPIDFDVVTEICFADRAAYERFVAKAAEPAIARRIAEDEENVFDRSATRMFIVDERTCKDRLS